MAKHIIVMHGRSIKPAEKPMRNLVLAALQQGLLRAGDDETAQHVVDGTIKVSLAYYGDINNRIQFEEDKSDRKVLTGTDPDHNNGPTLPHHLLEEAMVETLQRSPKFTKAAYEKVLDEAEDWRLLDDAIGVLSFFGAVATLGTLNEALIEIGKPDMGAYLTQQSVGSDVRERFQDKLLPCLRAKDDVLLLTHSMGCMVAYDVFWKLSHMSEYRDIRDLNHPVTKWITLGCPLAEPGVRKNLLDGHKHSNDKYPRNMFNDWVNIRAHDDFIAHKEKMKPDFKTMISKGWTTSIKDKQLYNCWAYHSGSDRSLISNPHDFYGYLINAYTGGQVSEWAKT